MAGDARNDYYAALQRHYGPVRAVAWLIVLLVAGAGVFAGLNTMYGAVVGRVRELAMLQTLGFSRRAIALSIVQEGTLLAAAGSLLAAAVALPLVNGAAVRFTMGAFTLRLDSTAPGDRPGHRPGDRRRWLAAARVASTADAGRRALKAI